MGKWINEIPEVANMQTERYLYKAKQVIPEKKDLYLHIFTDAGQKAWGICIYVRFLNDKKYESHLIYGNSRVGPTRTSLSIPKMELNGVVLGCLKAEYIMEAMKIPKENVYIHTDSMVTLQWIQKELDQLKLYVHNRVKRIKEGNFQIMYTPGTENPADLCTKLIQQKHTSITKTGYMDHST